MILYEGRRVKWKGRNVIVLERITKDRVKVCYESNPFVVRIVKRADIQRRERKKAWM